MNGKSTSVKKTHLKRAVGKNNPSEWVIAKK
jgi:hypothetical protein